jgi:enoyl-CoA hydratase
MTYATLILDETTPVATVTVNRPAVLNALNAEVLADLDRAFAALAANAGVRCVILTGAGDKAFVAGADIAAMTAMGAAEAEAFANAGHAMAARMERAPFPVIAAVNGFALGGGLELALCADFIYASARAKLGFPETGLAVIPGFGGTQRLRARVGLAWARELVYTGRILSAEEAQAVGLVNKVCAPEALLTEARATADTIASKGPLAIAAAKRAMHEGSDLPLDRALALEARLFGSCFATADQKEGMEAFLNKRKPSFSGR